MTKKSGKKRRKSPTFLLMTLNFNNIYLYLLISGLFSNSGKSRKIVSKNETGLSSVSNKNPVSLDSFQCLRAEKPSKIKDSSHSVYSLGPENLSYVIGLRKKQDTPQVVYLTLKTSRPGRSHSSSPKTRILVQKEKPLLVTMTKSGLKCWFVTFGHRD